MAEYAGANGRTARSREKAAQIRAAARRLFLANGVSATSMNAITAEAGVSKQTVYAYFPSKEALLEDVLAELVGRRAEQWQALHGDGAPLTSTDELRGELTSLAEVIVEALLQPDYVGTVRIVITEAARDPALGERFANAVARPVLAAVAATLRRGQEGGAVRAEVSEDAPRLLVGALLTFVLLEGLLRPDLLERPPRARIDALVGDFLRGIASP
ncbi:TetR/AcrR family transcriptional regulator [Egibacter rhizosphaerae]|uniref:TetR/AcrR family transcriptional regulator n=1 Tax=Egibacter rhizosphaerae TaxID=1670831 RepID=A0A411YC77_9ACTN|nr:TetR/AcrR family transcriptional regulator [Egibacter rhizosphaerae]QBI18809.1 TetR/AcrR family transcriptional regulator [Egibacter rhizosphaerae]